MSITPPTTEQVEAAQHILGFFHDPHGYEPGGFTSKLLDAWFHADMRNQAKLGAAFPDLAWAIDIYWNHGLPGLIEESEK